MQLFKTEMMFLHITPNRPRKSYASNAHSCKDTYGCRFGSRATTRSETGQIETLCLHRAPDVSVLRMTDHGETSSEAFFAQAQAR
jgi:hypothetical protein